jgi:hypothetical protein
LVVPPQEGGEGLEYPPHEEREGREYPPHEAVEPWAFFPGPFRKSFSTSFLLGIPSASLFAKESAWGFGSSLFFFPPFAFAGVVIPVRLTGEILSSISSSTFHA